MTVRLQLFGSPLIDCDGVTLALPFERRNQLVVQLALRRAWVGRSELAALLWPDQPPKLAFSNLRKTVFRLHDQPWGRPLEAQGGALRFVAETDVQAFEQALHEQQPGAAVALYRGTLLAGFDDDGNEAWTGWLRFERERLHAAWRAAALEHLAGAGDPAAGIALAARLLDADPLDETALRAQMTLLARAGQAARAREVYREFTKRLHDELGIAPGPELKALYAAAGQDAGAHAAAAAAAAVAPAQDDGGFIGRTAERQRIATLIAHGDVRLLCITGPGGVGKTRLARRALVELAPGFAQGAAFVALEDVDSAYDLGVRIAREAGVTLQGSRPPLAQLPDALRERTMLLVLDNFEQLAAEAARLEGLLAACPRLTLIVTSRVRLGLASEQLFPLEGLPCPEPEDSDRLEAFDAARLFVAAARRVEPALVPAGEAAAIVEICRQVGGLPLALEIAASFTRVLSCEAIADELREGTELLRSADPSRPARQASIEVVFEQSWRRLAPAERDALTRLALFRGGFTAAAARSVAGVSLPVLAALSDKSLLRKEGQRNDLHPLVQQLAIERLDGAARAVTAAAHASHFLRLLGELRPRIRHAERAALREAEIEFENIRAAWRWALDHGPGGELARAAPSLMAFCNHRGRRVEGLAMLREAMAGAAARGAPRLAAALSSAAAHLELRLDRYAEAERLALQAIEGTGRGGDAELQLQSAAVLGASCARLGRLPESKRWFERALRLAQEVGDATSVAATLDNLALVERSLGRLDGSLRLYQQALLQHRAIGDAGGEAMCLNNLGVLHVLRGETGPAREMLRAGRELCERHVLPSTRSMIENNLADIAMRAGDLASALDHAGVALEVSRTTGQRAIEVEARQVLVRVALARGELARARTELAAALEDAVAVGRPALLAHCVCRFAELLAAQGDEDCAWRVMAHALQQPAIVGAERTEAEARMHAWAGAAGARRAWKAPPLAELAQRIVVETASAHASLIAEMRAPGPGS